MSERVLGVVEREALDRARTRLVALRVEQFRLWGDIAELERLGVAEQTGDRSSVRLLQECGNVDQPEAKRLVGEAADLTARVSLRGEPLPPRLPVTATVAESGEIHSGHVTVIRETMTRLDRVDGLSVADWFGAERTLAEHARVLPPRMLRRYAKALIEHFDPDGDVPPEGEGACDELQVVRRRDGSLAFKGHLHDPSDAEAFLEVIDGLAVPFGPDDPRSLERRRLDGLKDLVHDARRPGGLADDTSHEHPDTGTDDTGTDDTESDDEALIPEPRRPEPSPRPGPVDRPGRALLTITMDHRWLQQAIGHGTLDSGALVDPHTVRRLACDADIVPIVLGSRSEPLDVGRLQRTVTDAIRRALNLRDGGCAFPSCSRRPRRCHAHHIRYWFHGGPTRLDNLVLLCRFHHQLIHAGHWNVEIHHGRPWFTPPPWIDPDQQPRLGGRPRVPL
ncbi:HNH endonuclease signature motif containing protein [Actinomycetospora sp. NBC_00405]|uniref:HNH endonuclease signature motif containing protein n=1 Tax=Actinomycetospora sp. NBC_00405 TaxID=2975952 RepID=UPI002E1A7312